MPEVRRDVDAASREEHQVPALLDGAAVMPTKLRTVYLVREQGQTPADTKPQVWIETTARGEITYGVRISAPTLGLARLDAETEFTKLTTYVRKIQRKKGEGEK